MTKDIRKIAIIGAGKMGGWLAKVLSQDYSVAVYDLDPKKVSSITSSTSSTNSSTNNSTTSSATTSLNESSKDSIHTITALSDLSALSSFAPDLLINAVSLQHTLSAFDSITPNLPKTCILADVASIKFGLPDYYKCAGFRFVSVHPMFGPTFANMDYLKEQNAVIIKESDSEGVDFFRVFFQKLGLRIFDYTFDEHDQMMAYSLTTPFVSSLVFAACMDSAAVPGTTFKKHREIACGVLSEDDSLIAEILFNPHSLSQIEKITGRLELLKHIIKGKDLEETKKFLDKLRKNVGSDKTTIGN
ncbi:prephenate dehydrogenase [Candidatus Micrarchaeota archaeon]|nr:prephenate dehydrogenase [Candidatus Micrarchaeota archaeon]